MPGISKRSRGFRGHEPFPAGYGQASVPEVMRVFFATALSQATISRLGGSRPFEGSAARMSVFQDTTWIGFVMLAAICVSVILWPFGRLELQERGVFDL